MQRSRAWENYRKTFRKKAVHQRFRGAGKQSTNIIFSLHSPLITLWENAWKMQRSRARENYRKTFRKTSCTPAFSWSRKTIDKYHVFMTLTVSNLQQNTGKFSVRAHRKTIEKLSRKQAIHWHCRVTCDELRIFLEFYRG